MQEGEDGHEEYKLLLAREHELAESAKVGALEAVQAAVMRRQGSVSLAEAAVQLVGEKTGAHLRPQAAADLVTLGLSPKGAQGEKGRALNSSDPTENVPAHAVVDSGRHGGLDSGPEPSMDRAVMGSAWAVGEMNGLPTARAGML